MDITTDKNGVSNVEHSSVVAALPPDTGTIVANDSTFRHLSTSVPNLAEVTRNAKSATNLQHSQGVLESIKRYPKAVMFSMALSLCLVMEGYDLALLQNFYGLPQFNRKFGVRVGDTDDYQLTSSWQSGLQNGAQVGQIAGLAIAGAIADHVGYKKTLLGAQFLMICFIFLFFFAQNVGMLFAAEFLCGLPWGAFQTLTTTYAADVTPIALRPILTTFVNMCWVIGQLLSTAILRGLLKREDDWAWRIPFAIQWVWPAPIIICILFAPESPYWLARHDRIDKARNSLRRLTSKRVNEEELEMSLAMIAHTNELEKSAGAGTTYFDCFKGTNLRRTEIACVTWIAQVGCGLWFGLSVVYFLQRAGFDPEQSFDFGIGLSGVALFGTLCAWFIMSKVGRRTLYLTGLGTMFTLLLIIGFLGIPEIKPAYGYASGALLMVFMFTYDLTVGPVCYSLVAEIPSTRLRIKTAVLARNCYNVAALCANFLNPPILNPTAWNLRGKGGFVWCGFCFLVLVWSFFRLPEPKGRSPAELDVLFEHNISARKFKNFSPDPFRSDHLKVTSDDVQSENIHDKMG
ncbi:uncharacterized protein Z518_04818 [Rhinocladiella mackenziei CBS 650.93]|uniref:Major facilitator superfamily (MFS) profile domain-containing protein n=1 Tax=Rhinocladiella mackenziei CBS 650.93 TaxID=1442369 RepID=A0A0D2FWZ1_9EURO|nr:uncharacterized protein Z518_04818 [Rhinocladiella mackenziei CBS 650.93]KIX06842.1 hypothetical protein Z518_04818 [Rhinocladiella mackenziei CBS 650.93]